MGPFSLPSPSLSSPCLSSCCHWFISARCTWWMLTWTFWLLCSLESSTTASRYSPFHLPQKLWNTFTPSHVQNRILNFIYLFSSPKNFSVKDIFGVSYYLHDSRVVGLICSGKVFWEVLTNVAFYLFILDRESPRVNSSFVLRKQQQKNTLLKHLGSFVNSVHRVFFSQVSAFCTGKSSQYISIDLSILTSSFLYRQGLGEHLVWILIVQCIVLSTVQAIFIETDVLQVVLFFCFVLFFPSENSYSC